MSRVTVLLVLPCLGRGHGTLASASCLLLDILLVVGVSSGHSPLTSWGVCVGHSPMAQLVALNSSGSVHTWLFVA